MLAEPAPAFGARCSTHTPARRGDGAVYALLNDYELPHHAEILMVKDVAVEHVGSVFSGIAIESGGDNDLTVGIHQHGVLPT